MVYIPKDPLKAKKKARSKYGNKIVHAQGRKFDSVIERDRFFYLQEAQRRGDIRNLRCQVTFSIDVNGEHICRYIADFVYEKNITITCHTKSSNWFTVVEDVKGGYKLPADFRLKQKLMHAVHGVDILIVKSPTLQI